VTIGVPTATGIRSSYPEEEMNRALNMAIQQMSQRNTHTKRQFGFLPNY
jgi:hypothetical protein